MTLRNSSLHTDIDDLTQRRTSIKDKWLNKQQNIAHLLASAVAVCRTNVDNLHQPVISSDAPHQSDFDRSLLDYLKHHAPVSVSTLSQIFSQENSEVLKHLTDLTGKGLIKFDADGQMVLSIVQVRDLFLD
jgi:predicted transcriptional regulator